MTTPPASTSTSPVLRSATTPGNRDAQQVPFRSIMTVPERAYVPMRHLSRRFADQPRTPQQQSYDRLATYGLL